MDGARGEFSQIPVLDVSGLYTSRTTAIREVAQALRGHLESVGFLYVAGHRVPHAAVEAVRDMSKAFFALPEFGEAQAQDRPQFQGLPSLRRLDDRHLLNRQGEQTESERIDLLSA